MASRVANVLNKCSALKQPVCEVCPPSVSRRPSGSRMPLQLSCEPTKHNHKHRPGVTTGKLKISGSVDYAMCKLRQISHGLESSAKSESLWHSHARCYSCLKLTFKLRFEPMHLLVMLHSRNLSKLINMTNQFQTLHSRVAHAYHDTMVSHQGRYAYFQECIAYTF